MPIPFKKMRLIGVIVPIILLLSFKAVHGGAVWIVTENPVPAAASGQSFDTALKFSSWGARAGGYSITVHYDPELIQISNITFPADSEFFGNSYADTNSFASGETRICALQTQYDSDISDPLTFADIHWTTVGAAWEQASIQVETQSIVDETWRSVEVETYGIQFVIQEVDTDYDGMDDEWEITYFGDTSRDGSGDYDEDGLTDKQEYENRTNPTAKDTDGDGYNDSDEVLYGSDPTSSSDTPENHRPDKPVIQTDITDVALRYHLFNVIEYNDPDGNALISSEWQIATDENFTQLVLNKSLEVGIGIIEEEADALLLTMSEPVFLPDTDYRIRVRLEDSTGLWSLWSDTVAFTTVAEDPYDSDNNGVDDSYQVDGDTDTNNNGINDSEEGITALSDAEQGRTVGIRSDKGNLSGLTASSTLDLPDGLLNNETMPYGLFSFRIDDLFAGETVDVTFYFPDDIPLIAKWYNYHSADGYLLDYTTSVVITGNKVVLSITDGNDADGDGLANAIIIDPSGPAFSQGSDSDTETDTDNGGEERDDDGGGGGCFITTVAY